MRRIGRERNWERRIGKDRREKMGMGWERRIGKKRKDLKRKRK